MAAKFLRAVAAAAAGAGEDDGGRDLQKQIGCMTGIFQIFDRQYLIAAAPAAGGRPRRLISGKIAGGGGGDGEEPQIVLEKSLSARRSSLESTSFSSSSCSSFSSLECNRSTPQQEILPPPATDRMLVPEKTLKGSPRLLKPAEADIRELVRGSIQRDRRSAAPEYRAKKSPEEEEAEMKESIRVLMKLKEAGRTATPPAAEAQRRLSFDGREAAPAGRLKEAPRRSLDGREAAVAALWDPPPPANLIKNADAAPPPAAPAAPGVVAKLMGLEAMPSAAAPAPPASSRPAPARAAMASPRVPVEPAPWKTPSGRRGSPAATGEAAEPSKDLRALKKILDSMHAKGLLESTAASRAPARRRRAAATVLKDGGAPRPATSPIVIMRPGKSVNVSIISDSVLPLGNAVDNIAPPPPASKRATAAGVPPVKLPSPKPDVKQKNGNSTSPRMQQSPPPKKKTADQSSKHRAPAPAANSPRRKLARHPDGRSLSSDGDEMSSSARSDSNVSSRSLPEPAPPPPPEQPSPVSVLDAPFDSADAPSPAKPRNGFSRRKLEIDSLVQKLQQLTTADAGDAGDAAEHDHIAFLVGKPSADERYISEILLASGFLMKYPAAAHSPGLPINPGLFQVLEQRRNRTGDGEKLRRRLTFDVVNELLLRKLETPAAKAKAVDGQQLLRELWAEMEQLKNVKCAAGAGAGDDGGGLVPDEEVMRRLQGWDGGFDREVAGIALDIERSLFKELVDDVVAGEKCSGGAVRRSVSGRRQSRQLFGL